ncbi:MAG: Hsp33 family molecular chaperone HslO [Alphaproteobacteria bacterium]|nr:Hsp33 family molecular chaperone HslO [Alphaproteobacteria bacterium]
MTKASDATTPPLGGTDDLLQVFQLGSGPARDAVRGRIVRLGPALDQAIGGHGYPAPIAGLLGEALTLAVLLGGMLKYEGVFTLQLKGSGAVRLLVADMTSAGAVRGYAQFDGALLDAAMAASDAAAGDPDGTRPSGKRVAALMRESVPRLLGQGYLAFTVDQGVHAQRYQGIVDLRGPTLTECVHHYFAQSEQMRARLKIAVGAVQGPGGVSGWRAGGIMIQRMPDADPNAAARGSTAAVAVGPSEDDAAWTHARALMESATDAELLDPGLASDRLLWRLFHAEEVHAHPPQPVRAQCRCSRERVRLVLLSLSPDSRDELAEDGILAVTCEFCGARYPFSTAELAAQPDAPPDAPPDPPPDARGAP